MSQLRSDGRAGLEAQRRALAAACKRQGWQLLEVSEAGRSAKGVRRPGLAEVLRLLERADVRALVALKPARGSQVLLDLARLLASAQRQGWALVALDCAPEPVILGGLFCMEIQPHEWLFGPF